MLGKPAGNCGAAGLHRPRCLGPPKGGGKGLQPGDQGAAWDGVRARCMRVDSHLSVWAGLRVGVAVRCTRMCGSVHSMTAWRACVLATPPGAEPPRVNIRGLLPLFPLPISRGAPSITC